MAESSTAGSHSPSRRDRNSLNVARDTTLGGMSTSASGRENRIECSRSLVTKSSEDGDREEET